ncbi:MAG: hypothetical protein IJW70_01935 [Clostridia bacterium]|nr:hypothetical protein [Clostridia bacterium]
MTEYVNFIARLIKNKFAGFNVLITAGLVIAVLLGLLLTFTYEMPADLRTQTGTVASFDQYENKWYHNLFGYTQGSYFKVEFSDGSYFEATGICYDCIDKALFEALQTGDRLTLVYHDGRMSPKRIYAIEYMGREYLALGDVEAEFLKNQRTSYVAGPCMMGVCVLTATVLYIVNYRKNKKNPA